MWDRIRVWFMDSETIVWARIQFFVGAVWAVLSVSDLSAILPAKWLPFWLIFSGIVTEMSRRAREPHDLNVKTIADLDSVAMPIKKADSVVVNEATGTVTITKATEIPPEVMAKAIGV